MLSRAEMLLLCNGKQVRSSMILFYADRQIKTVAMSSSQEGAV